MRYTDGRAWLNVCDRPSCASPIIEAHFYGTKVPMSTFTVPWKDAAVLLKYGWLVLNVKELAGRYYVEYWQENYGPPDQGWLITKHVHGLSGRPIRSS